MIPVLLLISICCKYALLVNNLGIVFYSNYLTIFNLPTNPYRIFFSVSVNTILLLA